MGNRNAPGCGQIIAACALVIFGAFGGCTAAVLTNPGSLLFGLWLAGGTLVGAFLAALALRRPRQ